MQPETRFAAVGNDRVAYQVLGHGPRDILYTNGFWHHLDIEWEDPELARFYRRLASFARLIRFDRRGTGLSDHPAADGLSEVERWLVDCDAVLDAAHARAPVIFAECTPEVGPLVLQYVDRHPERCSGLIFVNTGACPLARPDYPEGLTADAMEQMREGIRRSWGRPEFVDEFMPRRARDERFGQWWAKLCRAMASPRAVAENLDCWKSLDCRSVLPRIRVPTLVFGAADFPLTPIGQPRYLAQHIAGARFVELASGELLLCWLAPEAVDLVEEFVTGGRAGTAERAASAASPCTSARASWRSRRRARCWLRRPCKASCSGRRSGSSSAAATS